MASRPTSRSSKSSDVRRTLFRSLGRSAPANSGLDNASSSSQSPGLGEDEGASGSESIIVRKSDGTFDIDAPLAPHQHLELQDMERELAEQQQALKRHHVDLSRRLPELLRMKVLSLQQDNWMYEAEEDG